MSREQSRTIFVCEECGAQSPKWEGRCPQCGQWNTLVSAPKFGRSSQHGRVAPKPAQVQELSQVATDMDPRVSTPSDELNRVLGGGLVPGSLVLMAGDPGIGKSTLLLQTCAHFARQGQRVLYVSGEESAQQVKLRADRLGISGENLLFFAGTEVDEILGHLDAESPSLAVVDSVQTLFSEDTPSAAGTVAQVRECTRRLMQWTKERGAPLLLAGHVTKDGSVAGPGDGGVTGASTATGAASLGAITLLAAMPSDSAGGAAAAGGGGATSFDATASVASSSSSAVESLDRSTGPKCARSSRPR